jgi:hypothetical protein
VRFFLILLLTCFSAGAQEAPPDLLVAAGQCLGTAKHDWLDLAHRKAATVELGSMDWRRSLDQRAQAPPDSDTRPAGSHPHRVEQMLYVVDYITPDHSDGTVFPHSEGTVFSFLVGGDKHRRVLHLLFTTRFRQVFFPDDASQRIELVNPPYGGIGTHEEIISAIRKIGFDTSKIPVTQLQKPPDSISCEMENELP